MLVLFPIPKISGRWLLVTNSYYHQLPPIWISGHFEWPKFGQSGKSGHKVDISKAITNSNVKHSANECMYCWWKKSQTTTWDVWNPANNGINYLSTGYSFPSTVCVLCTRWPPLLTLYPQLLKPNKLMGRLMIHGYHHLAMILIVHRFLLTWDTMVNTSNFI